MTRTVIANLRKFIRRRALNLGLSQEHAVQLSGFIARQYDSRGPIGAVDYLKRVGDTIVAYYSHSIDTPAWVATHQGFPKQVNFLLEYGEEIALRVAKIARSITFSRITPAQVDKVVSAVEKQSEAQPAGLLSADNLVASGILALGISSRFRNPEELISVPTVCRYFKKTVSFSGKTENGYNPPIVDSLRILQKDSPLRRLPYWAEVIRPLTPEYVGRLLSTTVEDDGIVGQIGATQEGGGKLRMFAAPYTVIQCLLYPIHHWIADLAKTVPNLCTWDQQSGAIWAQEHLKKGTTVHSVDLSTATCRFPLSTQLRAMELLGLDPVYRDAIFYVSRGKWEVQTSLSGAFQRSHLQWTVGQPLGIAPSMSMFSLTHALLLAGICVICEASLDSFRVLGDDVVISDDRVHKMYIDTMKGIGVPISYHKSHSSARFAEFAGYSITPTSLVRPGQWRAVHNSNALALAVELGTPLKGEVSELLEQIQCFHLFRLGSYSPTPAEWPLYIRVASEMIATQLRFPVLVKGDRTWYDTILTKLEGSIRGNAELFGLTRTTALALGVRVFDHHRPNIVRDLFSHLDRWSDDDVVVHFRHAARYWGEGNHAMIAANCFTALMSLWERYLVSDAELMELSRDIQDSYRNYLWLPPRSAKALDGLYKQYIQVVDAISNVTPERRRFDSNILTPPNPFPGLVNSDFA